MTSTEHRAVLEHTVRKQQPFASRADIAAKLLQSILNLRFPIFFFFLLLMYILIICYFFCEGYTATPGGAEVT